MTEQEVRGLFTLARINVLNLWRLPNRYHVGACHPEEVKPLHVYIEGQTLLTRHELDFLNAALPTLSSPWWLVKTEVGLVELGWRKRVIHIEWTDTPIRYQDPSAITQDATTKDATSVHAWSDVKALEYLTRLSADIQICLQQNKK